MGRVKEFAVWLAECVYQFEMNDEEIISACRLKDTYGDSLDPKHWLQEQIDTVRDNPQVYQNLEK